MQASDLEVRQEQLVKDISMMDDEFNSMMSLKEMEIKQANGNYERQMANMG